MRKFFSLALLLIVSGYGFAQIVPTSAKMSLGADSIKIGDTVRLNIAIEKDVASDLSIAGFKDNRLTEKIEIIGVPRLDTLFRDKRHLRLNLSYLVTSFDAGNYLLDKFPILVGDKEPLDTIFAVGPVQLRVVTYDIDTTKHHPYDILDVIDSPFAWAEVSQWIGEHWIVIFAILVGICLVAFGVWWYLRRRAIIAAMNALPAHTKALMALEALHSKKMWQSGLYKDYFSILTDILRVYIDNRYHINAMEMTTGEILGAIKAQNPEKLLVPIRELLALADLVKFAQFSPDDDSCETAYFDVYYYVEQTKVEEIEDNKEDKK